MRATISSLVLACRRHSPVGSGAYAQSFFGQGLADVDSPFYAHLQRWSTTRRLMAFLSPEARAQIGDSAPEGELAQLLPEHIGDWPGLSRDQYVEVQTLLFGYLLSSQGDRMALAHSVENRCPFLDPNVVALSAAVNLKFDDGSDEKYLLRRAFENKLPAENLRKRKHPYRAPDCKSFVVSRPDYLELLLSDHELRKNELLNPTFCKLLTEKIFTTPLDEISTKENQTFIFLLSMALQHHQFVQRNFSGVGGGRSLDGTAVKMIDRRSQRDPQFAQQSSPATAIN